VESKSGENIVSFTCLQARLIRFVCLQINNGAYSERALARVLGVSQPQIHNVLKGVRKLTPELADRLMWKFGIDVLSLLDGPELENEASTRRSGHEAGPPRKAVSRETLARQGLDRCFRAPKAG
jgi:plasmid maintenance system antidote protein VapI